MTKFCVMSARIKEKRKRKRAKPEGDGFALRNKFAMNKKMK